MSESSSPTSETNPETPTLGGRLASQCDALRNDVDQARELAGAIQNQLADKSNEVAQLKSVLERTQQHVNQLDGHVQQLRRERHELANEAMNTEAVAVRLEKNQAEIARLRALLESIRSSSELHVEKLRETNADQFTQIDAMRKELQRLRSDGGSFANTQHHVAELTAAVVALQQRLSEAPAAPREFGEPEPEPDVINLSRRTPR